MQRNLPEADCINKNGIRKVQEALLMKERKIGKKKNMLLSEAEKYNQQKVLS